MDTNEIKNKTQAVDRIVQPKGNAIIQKMQAINKSVHAAESLEQQSWMCEEMASETEDPNESGRLYAQASQMKQQAEQYRMYAEQLKYQVQTEIPELQGYIEHYEILKSCCEENLKVLSETLRKIAAIASSKYAAGFQKNKDQVQDRLQENQSLYLGIQKRIDWINMICQSSGTQRQYSYGRSR